MTGEEPEPKYKISFVIPTLNSERTLRQCLESVRCQALASARAEIILADAGSTDSTLAIATEYGVEKVVSNPLKTGEAGKTAGIKASSGQIIALIDSDNVLEDPDWLRRMLEPFADPAISASEPIRFTVRDGDPALTRYFAMLGMNDPLCLFLGNYDRESMITGRWTDLSVEAEDRGVYLKLALAEDQLPTIGANGFVLRRSLLDSVRWEPFFFDIDIVQQAVAAGHRHVAKVKCGIVHLYCSRLRDFAGKQDRRVRDFLFFSGDRRRSYPWDRQRRRGIVKFCLCTLLVAPLLFQMLQGWRRRRDAAWLYHLPVCWITLCVYGLAVLKKALGVRLEQKRRDRWQQT